jgi:DNA-directed RNA polymerase subunit delta
MSTTLSKMPLDELELLSNKDITNLILEESKKPMTTADLFKKIIKLLKLSDDTFEKKIGDYYTALTTDKRFLLLDNGKWDLRSNHTSDKIIKVVDEDDEEEVETEPKEDTDDDDDSDSADSFDDKDNDDEEYADDEDDDLKDLVVVDEDELDSEQ